MTLRQHQVAFARDTVKLFQYIFEQGYEYTYGEALRTSEMQAIYRKTGKTTTSNSRHLYKLAVDLNIFKDGSLLTSKEMIQTIGDFWESLDPINRWGGNWKTFIDTPHFERNAKEAIQ